MCKGLGIDLCEISRMEKLLQQESFLVRYFTDREIGYVRSKGKQGAQTLAALYAAKEAFAKAVGTGLNFSLKEVEVVHSEQGCPSLSLSGSLLDKYGQETFFLSLTHEAGIAAAVCVREE